MSGLVVEGEAWTTQRRWRKECEEVVFPPPRRPFGPVKPLQLPRGEKNPCGDTNPDNSPVLFSPDGYVLRLMMRQKTDPRFSELVEALKKGLEGFENFRMPPPVAALFADLADLRLPHDVVLAHSLPWNLSGEDLECLLRWLGRLRASSAFPLPHGPWFSRFLPPDYWPDLADALGYLYPPQDGGESLKRNKLPDFLPYLWGNLSKGIIGSLPRGAGKDPLKDCPLLVRQALVERYSLYPPLIGIEKEEINPWRLYEELCALYEIAKNYNDGGFAECLSSLMEELLPLLRKGKFSLNSPLANLSLEEAAGQEGNFPWGLRLAELAYPGAVREVKGGLSVAQKVAEMNIGRLWVEAMNRLASLLVGGLLAQGNGEIKPERLEETVRRMSVLLCVEGDGLKNALMGQGATEVVFSSLPALFEKALEMVVSHCSFPNPEKILPIAGVTWPLLDEPPSKPNSHNSGTDELLALLKPNHRVPITIVDVIKAAKACGIDGFWEQASPRSSFPSFSLTETQSLKPVYRSAINDLREEFRGQDALVCGVASTFWNHVLGVAKDIMNPDGRGFMRPHLLAIGNTGTGKTTTVLAVLKEMGKRMGEVLPLARGVIIGYANAAELVPEGYHGTTLSDLFQRVVLAAAEAERLSVGEVLLRINNGPGMVLVLDEARKFLSSLEEKGEKEGFSDGGEVVVQQLVTYMNERPPIVEINTREGEKLFLSLGHTTFIICTSLRRDMEGKIMDRISAQKGCVLGDLDPLSNMSLQVLSDMSTFPDFFGRFRLMVVTNPVSGEELMKSWESCKESNNPKLSSFEGKIEEKLKFYYDPTANNFIREIFEKVSGIMGYRALGKLAEALYNLYLEEGITPKDGGVVITEEIVRKALRRTGQFDID